MIQQQVMSQTLLTQIIHEFGLHDGNVEDYRLNIPLNVRKKSRSTWLGQRKKHRSFYDFFCP